jgi:hypothetical protein
MPVPEDTPDRRIRIQRNGPGGIEQLFVMESAFDTVAVRANGATYKMLGYEPVSELRDGEEIAFVPRSKLSDNPDRQAVAAEQVAIADEQGTPIPKQVRRIAEAPQADPKADADK